MFHCGFSDDVHFGCVSVDYKISKMDILLSKMDKIAAFQMMQTRQSVDRCR
jgi:hypothetical protein